MFHDLPTLEIDDPKTSIILLEKGLTCMEDEEKLNKLTGIKKLIIYNNKFDHIAPFNREDCLSLVWLELQGNNLPRIENLHFLVNLNLLYLAYNAIKKIENLGELKNLRILNLGKNSITKIEGLDELVNLEELFLNVNFIKVIENLDKLTNLKILDLASNLISNLENLGTLRKLECLSVQLNQIQTLQLASNVNSLKKLNWSNNGVKKLDFPTYVDEHGKYLSIFPNLEYLSIKYNGITSIKEINKLKVFSKLRNLVVEDGIPLTDLGSTTMESREAIVDALPGVEITD